MKKKITKKSTQNFFNKIKTQIKIKIKKHEKIKNKKQQ